MRASSGVEFERLIVAGCKPVVAVQGNGKSISNGYLYSVKKTSDANCAAAAPEAMRVPGATQAQ